MSNTQHRLINSNQKQILTLLVKHKFLTTVQIHNKLESAYSKLTTWRWLKNLRELRMVSSFATQPHKGNNSEFGWLLTAKGARSIGFAKYNSHYQRPPNQQQLHAKEVELAIEKQVYQAGWELLYPQTVSPTTRLSNNSEQYEVISQAVRWDEYLRIGTISNQKSDFATLTVPLKANTHVAYYQEAVSIKLCKAVILIICPVRAGHMFWEARIRQYEALAKKIPVLVVLADYQEEQKMRYEQFLSKHYFRIIFVSHLLEILETL
jgi:hypothetical protein